MLKIVAMNDLKNIPSIDRILKEPAIKKLLEYYSHDSVVKLVQQNVNELRNEIKRGKKPSSLKKLISNIELSAEEKWLVQPSPVINASGVILHTNFCLLYTSPSPRD